ncbi:hypothetical protein GCM10010508_17330 [Streptomyces naganishii JCM 4654]|uniref:Thioredoxin domain-containing protein n=2 Tax=Streptomyces naganishii TaxID=285447 RepID=A0A918Y0L8_9ACTN|nr:hypothetical protein GCM10010508_17330 [Streptomyces naganishii JCM 4654]
MTIQQTEPVRGAWAESSDISFGISGAVQLRYATRWVTRMSRSEWSRTKPVVLDFSAEWCYWCQKEKPYLQRYNTADNGAWVWARVDVDENPDLTQQYQVDGIPALVDIKNGTEAGSRMVGFDGPSSLRDWLNRL